MKQVQAAPWPEWYWDTEWNVSLWGAYAFTETDSNRSGREQADDKAIFGTYDHFLGGDHAWGGGLDVKYFFRRYFGIGFEGFALAGRGSHLFTDDFGPSIASEEHYEREDRAVGGALATFTFRYPIHCSRLSPYVWGGVGGMFNGGERDVLIVDNSKPTLSARTEHRGSESDVMGQFGGGLEFRFTRHLGWTNDVSWNIVEGPDNNFGMVRSGLTFSF